MILQNDPRIQDKFIHDYGCAEMVVNYYLNKKKHILFSPGLIDRYHYELVDHDCYTRDMDILWERAFAFHGMHVHVSFEEPGYELKEGEFAAGEWHNDRTKFTHFTAVGGTPGHYICTFDSLGESVTVREGKLVGLRVFKEI